MTSQQWRDRAFLPVPLLHLIYRGIYIYIYIHIQRLLRAMRVKYSFGLNWQIIARSHQQAPIRISLINPLQIGIVRKILVRTKDRQKASARLHRWLFETI